MWGLVWTGEDTDGYINFLSCSADGTVKLWTVVRTFLRQTELFRLTFSRPLSAEEVSADLVDGGTAVSLCPGRVHYLSLYHNPYLQNNTDNISRKKNE